MFEIVQMTRQRRLRRDSARLICTTQPLLTLFEFTRQHDERAEN
jgi:hypothetical protein